MAVTSPRYYRSSRVGSQIGRVQGGLRLDVWAAAAGTRAVCVGNLCQRRQPGASSGRPLDEVPFMLLSPFLCPAMRCKHVWCVGEVENGADSGRRPAARRH